MSFDAEKIEAKSDLALVVKVESDKIFVQVVTDSCKSCAISGMCKVKDKIESFKVKDASSYKVGDYAEILISSGSRIFSAFMIFIFPIIIMILFYLAASLLFKLSEGYSIIASFTGLIFGGFLLWIFDKKLGKKMKYEIKKWSPENENSSK